MSSDVDLLRKMPVFGGLSNESLELIIEQAELVSVAAGEYFVRENDPGKSLFVLRSGSVVIEKQWQGNAVELGRLSTGDCFGEMALIDFQPRSASIKAEVDCEAIEIESRSLRVLHKRDVEQYAMIMMNMGREVSRRLRKADERLFTLDQQSAE